MIICGYAGIGKSYLAKNTKGVMDLESTPFERDWERYAKCAIHYHKQGYVVLVSCHKEIREKLYTSSELKNGDVITVLPNIEDKEIYRERYINRGNSEQFVKLQMDNWENWLNEDNNKLPNEVWIEMSKNDTLFNSRLYVVGADDSKRL